MSTAIVKVIRHDGSEMLRFITSDGGSMSLRGPNDFAAGGDIDDFVEMRRQLDNAIAFAQGVMRARAAVRVPQIPIGESP